jgi:hypothetical protein
MVLEYYWTTAYSLIGAASLLNYPDVTFFSAVSDYIIRCNGYNLTYGLPNRNPWSGRCCDPWIGSITEQASIGEHTSIPRYASRPMCIYLFCKHAIIFSLSGPRKIYQPTFCPDVRARRRGAVQRIYFSVWERPCRDQTSSSVKLEVVCCHSAVVWSLLFPRPPVCLW